MTVTRLDSSTASQCAESSSSKGLSVPSGHAQEIPVLSDKVVNVSSVPQRSPLRYPGGKTWLVPQIRKFLEGLDFRPEVFVEPFAGGGIASLTAVMEDYVDRAVLCEKDPDVANLWQCMLDDPEDLAIQGRRVRRHPGERGYASFRETLRSVRHGRCIPHACCGTGSAGAE